MFNNSQDYQIGGPGLTVEVDESMFGKLFMSMSLFLSMFMSLSLSLSLFLSMSLSRQTQVSERKNQRQEADVGAGRGVQVLY